jgi:hypothetical protein
MTQGIEEQIRPVAAIQPEAHFFEEGLKMAGGPTFHKAGGPGFEFWISLEFELSGAARSERTHP